MTVKYFLRKPVLILIMLLIALSLITGCMSQIEDDETQHTPSGTQPPGEIKKENEPHSLKILVKTFEYYQKMNEHDFAILEDKKAFAFEQREHLEAFITPILTEAQKTNVYELNSLYPGLGTQFYTKFIPGLKIVLSMKNYFKSEGEKINEASSELLKSAILYLSKGKMKKEVLGNFDRSTVLLKQWEDWLSRHADKMNGLFKKRYITGGLKITARSAKDYISRGDYYLSQKEYDSALYSFNNAINLEPDNDEAFVKRGQAYFGKQKYEITIKN